MKNAQARREAQGIVGLWPSFATQHPRVFRGQHRGRDGFRPALVAHRLQRPTLLPARCLTLDEIRRRRELRNKR